jgi:hypothetical protein
MGRVLLLTIAGIALAFAVDRPDFSGNWTLNLDRSSFGTAPKPTGMTLKVTRDGDATHAVQTTDSQAGPTDVESNWILDGQEHDTGQGKVLTRWEGNTLYSERKSDAGAVNEKIWLAMSADGKTATEKVVTTSPQGTNICRLIWQRQ